MVFDINTFDELHTFMFCHLFDFFKNMSWVKCYQMYKLYDSEETQLMDSAVSTCMCEISLWGV